MTSKIRALIIDDERLARNALRNKLNAFKHIDVVGEANGITTGMNAIKNHQPDLLFLDIQLYNETGFDLLDRVDYEGKVIFVTAYDQYAIRAFEINALDYLLKPISVERLGKALERLDEPSPKVSIPEGKYSYEDRVMVPQTKGMKFIQISSIVYINSAGDYTKLHTLDGEFLMSKSMNDWEKDLPENHFFRIHRSHLVNINHIEKTEKWINYSSLIYLSNIREPLKISRSYLKKFKERFG